ncbi:MAG: hypothetical protein E7Z85_00195 [Methanosphaera stadtmanae]|nr:hypothetical protein [Methanosphaera stadtmanae]
MDKKQMIVLVIAMLMLFYIGSTMFYNTGLGITDLNVEETDANGTQYDLFFMLRSVRNFEFLDLEYTLFSEDNEVIATGSTIMTNITDGTFNINETLNRTNDDSSKVPKEVEIKIYEEKFNPEQKNADGSYSQKVFFEQRVPINN